ALRGREKGCERDQLVLLLASDVDTPHPSCHGHRLRHRLCLCMEQIVEVHDSY
ncbi:hypothetical protein U1Q18_006884, partial [Sarracenia purpurea var. burkii]